MKFFKLNRARSLGGLLAGLGVLVTALVATGSAALAMPVPGTDGDADVVQPPVVTVVGGMPGWEITLIAVGAALVAAMLAVLADRTWSARGRVGAAAARASEA
ncbi:MAG TPA: hypothetical protein VH594_02455 [Trebonia sp.]|jgi:hypothetical protein